MGTSQRRVLTLLTAAAVALGPLAVLTSPPASAAIRDQALSGNTSPMWQTNNEVDTLEVSGTRVYAGGKFTRVRPPGAAVGTNETTRTYLAAFNTSNGTLATGFNVTLNGVVEDISASPDGTRIYIVGRFTTVNGQPRQRIAAVNATTGSLIPDFIANANSRTRSVDASNSTVYVSGDFSAINGVGRTRMASLSASTGAVNPDFDPTLNARGNSILIAPDGSRVLVGGNFDTVNGVFTGGMASLDPSTGATRPWEANTDQPINTNCVGRVSDIVASGGTAYVTGEGDPPGCYEGTYSARISDGHMNWLSSCLGASQGLALMDGLLYKASHQHDCAFTPGDARGGYVGGTARDTFVWYRMVAQNTSDGSFTHWSPDTNGTMATHVGPHTIATDGNQMFVGGDFSQVNRSNQMGIARFARGSGATPESAPTPTVQPNKVGAMTVIFPSVYDRDSGTLTYTLYRNGGATPIYTRTVESFPWSRPMLRFDDTGLTPGATYSYRVRVSDGTHQTALSPTAGATVRGTAPPAYDALVNSLGANLHWKLGESGSTFTNSATGPGGSGGERVGTIQTGQSGALASDPAITLNGSGSLTSISSMALSPSFSQSLWFKTTSITGGSLMAVTDAKTGVGTYSDRAVTMDNNGNIVFSVHRPAAPGSPDPLGPRLNNVRQQGPIFNDGTWHQMVATWDNSTGTATLYVDGIQLGQYVGTAGGLTSGHLRVGYTDLAQEQAVFGRNYYNRKWPETEHFSGGIDEVSLFPRALTGNEVGQLFAAGVSDSTASPPAPVAPTAAFTPTMNNLNGSFDGSASNDPDGTITSWDWEFGDGNTDSGEIVTHTYGSAGSYNVKLTVTDNQGLSNSVTHTVNATEPSGTPVESVAVDNGAPWSWKYNAAAPPANWNTAAFNRSTWQTGNAVLGFGATVATDVDCCAANTSTRPLAAYFTRAFNVPDASQVTALRLDTVANDGVVIYVNGQEVNRTNMPSGPITINSYAVSARNVNTANADPVVVDVPVGLLVDGTNIVSAESHLNYRNTRDVTFDLKATLTTASPGGSPPAPAAAGRPRRPGGCLRPGDEQPERVLRRLLLQ